jgi:hypothetical protein
MMSAWQTQTGHLVCRWSDEGLYLQYKPNWMQDTAEVQSSYLSSLLPDFTKRSPFGGAFWYQSHNADRE